MKILLTVPFSDEQADRIAEAAGPDAVIWRSAADDPTYLADADVIVGEPSPALITNLTNIKLIQMTWAGTDLYTRNAIPFPKGAALCNAVGGFGHIISQHVVGQVLNITMNLAGYHALQAKGEWGDLGQNMSLEGANVLIFGAGNIGGDCARRLRAFDVAKVTGVCRSTADPRPYFDELVTLDEAEGLLGESDIVIGALPTADETVDWLNAERLSMMKEGSVLVNVGRGTFVNNLALAEVLVAGRLRGAALDVTAPEPLPEGHPLWTEPRCLITPHCSGGSFRNPGTAERICEIACANIRNLVAGEPLINQAI